MQQDDQVTQDWHSGVVIRFVQLSEKHMLDFADKMFDVSVKLLHELGLSVVDQHISIVLVSVQDIAKQSRDVSALVGVCVERGLQPLRHGVEVPELVKVSLE